MNGPERRPFGVTAKGETVEVLQLRKGALDCQILTFGATLRTLTVPDREGNPVDVTLGYDTLEEYETQNAYLGAVVGRSANRMGKAQFTLNGTVYHLAQNKGANHLHGGVVGFSHQVWTVEELTEDKAVLSLHSPDGQEGYPGNLTVTVTYQLEADSLSIRYQAVTDKDTVCNLTNHAYFNLDGHGAGSVLDHELTLYASHFTPTDAESIPLGTLEPVEGTPLDWRTPTPIGARIDDPCPQLVHAGGYDQNFAVDGPVGTLRPMARVVSHRTGIVMEGQTTLPGVQLYTSNNLTRRKGKDGAVYDLRGAFCLETQFFPDSPNQPNFLPAVLRVGETLDHTAKFIFSTL